MITDQENQDANESQAVRPAMPYEPPMLEELDFKVEGSFLGSSTSPKPNNVPVEDDEWADYYD